MPRTKHIVITNEDIPSDWSARVLKHKSAAGRALAESRWQGHTTEPTQPRRLKLSTIARVQRHAQRVGTTFDGALIDLLDRAETQ